MVLRSYYRKQYQSTTCCLLSVWFVNDTLFFFFLSLKFQISLIGAPNIYMVFSVFKTKWPKERLPSKDWRTEKGTERWHRREIEKTWPRSCGGQASQFRPLVSTEGSTEHVEHECLWLTTPLTVISSLPQRWFYLSFHIIDSYIMIHWHLPFIATTLEWLFSLQVSFP